MGFLRGKSGRIPPFYNRFLLTSLVPATVYLDLRSKRISIGQTSYADDHHGKTDLGPRNEHRSRASEHVLGVFQNLRYLKYICVHLCSTGRNLLPILKQISFRNALDIGQVRLPI